MKYLVITKGPSLLKDVKVAHLERIKEQLQTSMKEGTIEACFGLVAGGTVWIVNADSHAALARALRDFQLSSVHNVEVLPIVDGISVIDAYIEANQTALSE